MYELFGFELADFKELFYVFLPRQCLFTATSLSGENTRSLEPETKQATSVISAV
ncbi:hypothetical protein IE988_31060 [Klebsiella pneumoniae]|uniref:Uncharacterized protein n=1 Tax=Klebsiella pneumoniae TaxID=573 RepID=A0A927HUL4_KLEPN|nr:hypothetical protein [Klebsiella pneumoniae]